MHTALRRRVTIWRRLSWIITVTAAMASQAEAQVLIGPPDLPRRIDTARILQEEITVAAPLAEVWQAWTTPEGVRRFFAAEANVRLEIGGPYELLFDLAAPRGSRGSEGMKILSYLPMKMLSFEWNAPDAFTTLRHQRTWVVVEFDERGESEVHIRLSQLGWGEGPEWDLAYEFFQQSWRTVLRSCQVRLSRR